MPFHYNLPMPEIADLHNGPKTILQEYLVNEGAGVEADTPIAIIECGVNCMRC